MADYNEGDMVVCVEEDYGVVVGGIYYVLAIEDCGCCVYIYGFDDVFDDAAFVKFPE